MGKNISIFPEKPDALGRFGRFIGQRSSDLSDGITHEEHCIGNTSFSVSRHVLESLTGKLLRR